MRRMQTVLNDVPNDIKTLKERVLNQMPLRSGSEEQTRHHLDTKKQREQANHNDKIQVLSLQEQLNILLYKR